MFKKFVAALALSLLSSGAFAACVNPLSIKDGTGAAISMSTTSNADGFCQYNFNAAQINGAVPLMGNGVTGTGSLRVTVASDNTPFGVTVSGVSTAANQTSELTKLDSIITNTGAATPAGTNRIGYTSDDPCNNASAKVYTPINVVTATNVIITGVSAKNKYICSIFLYPAAADNVAIYQATTGTACATAQVAILGGTTTATGFIMTAQAGFVVGTGSAAVAKTTVVNTDICVTTSAAVQLSGVVVTADQ